MSTVLVNYKHQTVTPSPEIMAAKAELTALAIQLRDLKVTNPVTQDAAVDMQKRIKQYMDLIKTTIAAVRKPLKTMDTKVVEWGKDMVQELNGIAGELAQNVNEYQLAEMRRVAAAKRAQDEAASALTREMDQKVSEAATVNEQEAIREEYRDKLAAEASAPLPAVHRSKGQDVRSKWEITVTDIHMLYRHHPHCVKLSELKSEITLLLDEGTTPKGVTAKKVINSGVRLTKEAPVVEI